MNHDVEFKQFNRDRIISLLLEVQRLQTERTYRDSRRLFFLEGVRNFIRAVDNQLQFSTIIYSEKLLTAPVARKLLRQKRRSGVACCPVSPEQFRQISRTEKASGIGAIAFQPWRKLSTISANSGLCWIVLDQVRSPGNFGTLIRTSEAFGGAGFILLGQKIDPFSPDVIRAAMGAVFRQTFVRTNGIGLQKWVQQQYCRVIGASPHGTIDLHQLKYTDSILLFLGEERQGLTPTQRDFCHQLVRIPMIGTADSLNLAIAGSVMMYEIQRSRLIAVPKNMA